MKKIIKRGDYILITDIMSNFYLQIGEVIEIDYYPGCDDVKSYKVRFARRTEEYKYDLPEICKVLLFADR